MAEASDRFALPFIAAGQAQKEILHNEALMLLDCLVQPVVVSVAPASVPVTPALGQCWIVGLTPAGDWSGKAKHIACWTSGGWRFAAPLEGTTCWSVADGVSARFASGNWLVGQVTANVVRIGGNQVVGARQSAIASPTGGTTNDTEARLAIASILTALRTHGLISP
jgi:Protein of unknown function (DUF2793)